VDDASVRITASFGVSAVDGTTLGQQELIDQADAAMRQSKRPGATG